MSSHKKLLLERLLINSEREGHYYDLCPQKKSMAYTCLKQFLKENISIQNWVLFEIPYWDKELTVLCFSNPRTHEYVSFHCCSGTAFPIWIDEYLNPISSNSVKLAISKETQRNARIMSQLEKGK